MPLSDANVIQENSGTTTGTSHAVTLGSGTTAGNTLLVYAFPSPFTATPTDFVLDAGGGSGIVGVYRESEIAAGETSWTFSTAASIDISWYVKEVSNIDAVEPLDVSTVLTNGSMVNGGTLSTGTTARNAGLSVMVDVIYGAGGTGGTRAWSSYTNDFAEAADVSGTNNGIAVATKYVSGTTSTFESTATLASSAGMAGVARLVAYRAADAPLAAPLAYFTGFEWGTYGGMGNAFSSNPFGSGAPSGTAGTTYNVSTSYGRNGGYGLRLSVTASTTELPSTTLSSAKSMAFGFNCRVQSATGVATIARMFGSVSDVRVVYDGSTNKFGLVWGTGTVQYQSGTTALNTWVWIDVRCKVGTTTHHADWRIETATDTYTDQTSPADLSTSAGTMSFAGIGPSSTSTVTVDYDDFVTTRYYAAYPLGPHQVRVLVPATTGASVVGTSTNFSKFTANGALAAWGSDAGALLDEVPPTVSASADGVVQTAVAASDYMVFPMADPSLASDEVFAAARYVAATWGGTGTGTGTLWQAVYDGTTETVVDAGSVAYDGDSLTAVSGTYPIWRNKLIPAPAAGWSPTAANALEARVGKSSDATPDMGVNAIYIEYATRKAITARQVTIDDPMSATVDLLVNPYSSASVSYVVTNNDATRSVNLNYSISGTSQTPVTVSPSSNQTVSVNMDAFGDISDLSLEPQ